MAWMAAVGVAVGVVAAGAVDQIRNQAVLFWEYDRNQNQNARVAAAVAVNHVAVMINASVVARTAAQNHVHARTAQEAIRSHTQDTHTQDIHTQDIHIQGIQSQLHHQLPHVRVHHKQYKNAIAIWCTAMCNSSLLQFINTYLFVSVT